MKRYCLAILLLSAAAWSQPSDDSQWEEPRTADASNPYVRKPRSAAVSLEAGMNSLSSLVGIKGSFFVSPQFAVDVGIGSSSVGLRPGVYARYLFSKAKFTPFVYGGAKYGLGSGGTSVEVEDTETDTKYQLEVKPSPFVDFGLGIDYLAHNGFYFTGGLGWSQLLGGKNYSWDGPEPSEEFDDVMAFVLGSGLALSLSLGYAF